MEGESILTPTPACAHVLAALGNVGTQFGGFVSPEPLFEVAPAARDDGFEDHASLRAAGHPVAVGPRDAVVRLADALRNLPPCTWLVFGAVAAAVGGVYEMLLPIRDLPARAQRQALRSAGLSDQEIDSVDLGDLVDVACEAEPLLSSWGAVSRWLRAQHTALGGRSPLEVLAERQDVGPALDDPYDGRDPPATTWEPEAIACYRAAQQARWGWQQLRRDRDGGWSVVGPRRGVRVGVYSTLLGVRAGSQTGPRGSWAEGFVPLRLPVDPVQAPAQLARRVDRWVRKPENRDLALERVLERVARAGALELVKEAG